MNSHHHNRPSRTRQSRRFSGPFSPALTTTVLLLVMPPAVARAQGEADPGALKIDAEDRSAIIDTVCSKLNELYVFPDIAGQMGEHLRRRQKNRAYDDIGALGEFVSQLNTDLLSVYPDGHLESSVLRKSETEKTSDDDDDWWDRRTKEAQYHNFYFRKVEWFPGNIGYVDWRKFEYPELSGPTAVAVMGLLAYSDALIIDLRMNPGGRGELMQLVLSYFFEDHRVHYLTDQDRGKDTAKQWWTIPYVPGRRMADIPLYILTSKNTGSAAEKFAYALKHLGRATIVGERTAGAAHKTHRHNFPELQIAMHIPDGTSVSPVTGKDWEGTGVRAHIAVPADQAYDAAYAEALKTLLEKEVDELKRHRLEWVKMELDARRHPMTLDDEKLKEYTGNYGLREISFKEGTLSYQSERGQRFSLIPLEDDLFMLDDVDHFRIRFSRDDTGAVKGLVGLYNDGRRSPSRRTAD